MTRVILLDDDRATKLSVRAAFWLTPQIAVAPDAQATSAHTKIDQADLDAIKSGAVIERVEVINAARQELVREQRLALNDDDPDYGKIDPETFDFKVPVYKEKLVDVKTYVPWSDEEMKARLEARWSELQSEVEVEEAKEVLVWDGGKWE